MQWNGDSTQQIDAPGTIPVMDPAPFLTFLYRINTVYSAALFILLLCIQYIVETLLPHVKKP